MISRKIYYCIQTFEYLVNVLLDGFNNPYKGLKLDKTKRLLCVANGPSAKELYSDIKNNFAQYKNCEFSVVNDFVNDDLFEIIKPLHYTISDPMFFMDTVKKQQGVKVLNALNKKVKWDMYLNVSCYWKKSSFLDIVKCNPQIHIVYFHQCRYDGIPHFTNYFYKKGWGNGEYGTVILNALYAAISEGYKDIHLYGVDHTFFDGLTVNEDNIPCYIYKHSYDIAPELKPIRFTYNYSKEYMDMASYIYEKYDIFKGHKIMAAYAKSVNCNVLNCTKNSLIDAYPRLKE